MGEGTGEDSSLPHPLVGGELLAGTELETSKRQPWGQWRHRRSSDNLAKSTKKLYNKETKELSESGCSMYPLTLVRVYIPSKIFLPRSLRNDSAIIGASSISKGTLVVLVVATTSGRIETPLKAYTILRSVESGYEGEVSMAGWFFARELCTAWNNADPRGFHNR